MSIVPVNPIVVNSEATVRSLLDDLVDRAVDPPSLYLDLEGVRLGRHGSISIVSLYVLPLQKTYLIDIHCLGKTAFSTKNSRAISLKSILESPNIPKVFFDIRNDSDALFSHYEVFVDGIKDLQLMELATRKGSQEFVAGLAKCIEKDGPMPAAAKWEWQRTKESAVRLYNPEKGGQYEVFNERPIRPEIMQYCAQDVALLPGLYNVYNASLRSRINGGAFWRVQVRNATTDRIKLSQSSGYDGQAESDVCGPWNEWNLERALDDWNDEVLFNARTGDAILNEDDIWVAPPVDDSDDYDDYNDSARDCIGWEEDMEKNGEYF